MLGPPGRQVSPVRLSLPHFRLRPPLGDRGRTERAWAHTAGLPTLPGHLSHLSWLTTKASTRAALDLPNAITPTSPRQSPCRWTGRHFVQMTGREAWGWGIPATSGQADKRPHLSVPGGAPGQPPVPGPPLPLPLPCGRVKGIWMTTEGTEGPPGHHGSDSTSQRKCHVQ